ncbi:unnamed protein product [Polarella glacialis]|uniref:RING-type domain-containing protein n=1 Tax=Polarella glacialis TaxID=89957 RepID=A0A813GF11_POLGL|nr:unnamed protein product [Polarella glacialis]
MGEATGVTAHVGEGSSLGRVMRPQTLESVRQVEALEQQQWYEGWDVTVAASSDSAVGSTSSASTRRGCTTGYDSASGNLLVRLEFSLQDPEFFASEQLLFDFQGDSALPPARHWEAVDEELSTEDPRGRELLAQARSLFIPGTRFEGTIAIPGMQQAEGRQPYSLDIVSEIVDELGSWSLLARHSAYSDEQACNLTFQLKPIEGAEAEVTISYADGETRCEGTVSFCSSDRRACTLRGRVLQFLQGEEGFLEPSEEVTHFFELKRATTHEAHLAHNRRLEVARKQRLEELFLWLQSSAAMTRDASLALRREIPWKDIVFTDIMRLCEVQCASVRRQSQILNHLRFTTAQQKEEKLQQLREAGLNRQAGHEGNDAAILRLKTLLTAAMPAMRQELDHLHTACLQATTRLYKSYCQLDKAMRSAETRLPKELLQSWLCSAEESQESPCAVCFLPLVPCAGGEEELVRLPCTHLFHMECVAQWLHAHTTCPNCRHELSSAESTEAPSTQQEESGLSNPASLYQ